MAEISENLDGANFVGLFSVDANLVAIVSVKCTVNSIYSLCIWVALDTYSERDYTKTLACLCVHLHTFGQYYR